MINPRTIEFPGVGMRRFSVPSWLALIVMGGCGEPSATPVVPTDQVVVTEDCCKEKPAPSTDPLPGPTVAASPTLPDVPLRNQRGERVHFYSDLVKDKIVAINFIFTSCKGVCPPLGANFAALSRLLREQNGTDVALISVSVDPVNDGPKDLASWSQAFDADPAWTLVTGEKPDVDRLLKALGVYSVDKTQHSPLILLGDESSGTWSRLHGLTEPAKISEAIGALFQARRTAARTTESHTNPSAHRYFTDVELDAHDGRKLRLYTDLMRGKVIVVQSFFCSCDAACPSLVSNFTAIQDRFKNRMGKDLHLLSITVDPERDTPSKLKEYAERIGAGPGWFFLTGSKQNIDLALLKFGQKVEARDNHSNLFIIGNDVSGLWKKAMGLAKSDSLLEVVASVLDDPGATDPSAGDGR